MATKINRTEEIKARLLAEGKVEIMNSPEAIAISDSIDEQMEQALREYKRKARQSEIDASRIILTS